MPSVAEAAGVSRATLYRHFPSPAELERAVRHEALAEAEQVIARVLAEPRPPLAVLRRVVDELVRFGSVYALGRAAEPPLRRQVDDIVQALFPLAEQVRRAAQLSPAPPLDWLRTAGTHFVESCLEAGSRGSDPRAAGEKLFETVTESLDQGLVIADRHGRLLATNPPARQALALEDPGDVGRETRPRGETFYDDGSPCPPEAYPIAIALRTGEPQRSLVRGHRVPSGELRWFSVHALPLRTAPDDATYGLVAVLSDITEHKRAELAQLHPPGTLGREQPVALDVARVLDKVPAHVLPEQLVAEARRLAGVPVALYVVDIDGTHLLRLAGPEEFPARLKAPLALGPELAEDGIPDLRTRLESELPGVAMAPMWLRGRAVGVLLALRGSEAVLADVARHGAAAMELAGGYTDVFDAARRRNKMNPAAEIQQSLLPPRIVRLGAGEIGGSVLPSYDVGGDWFDYVENRDGAWIAIADAAGRGPTAGGLGSVALAALRAARRNDASLEEAAQSMHDTIQSMERPEFFVTAIVARWSPAYSVVMWINAGHPPPLLLRPDGRGQELTTQPELPLGIPDTERRFRRSHHKLDPGDRVVLYTDGISRRPTKTGVFGRDGITRAAASSAPSATATARAIQEAVVSASSDPLRDDAAVVVLAPVPPKGRPA